MRASSPDRPRRLVRSLLASPIAPLQLFTDENGVVRVLDFDTDSPRTARLMRRWYGGLPVEAGRRRRMFAGRWTPISPAT